MKQSEIKISGFTLGTTLLECIFIFLHLILQQPGLTDGLIFALLCEKLVNLLFKILNLAEAKLFPF
jgi:hypothetical protein